MLQLEITGRQIIWCCRCIHCKTNLDARQFCKNAGQKQAKVLWLSQQHLQSTARLRDGTSSLSYTIIQQIHIPNFPFPPRSKPAKTKVFKPSTFSHSSQPQILQISSSTSRFNLSIFSFLASIQYKVLIDGQYSPVVFPSRRTSSIPVRHHPS